MTSTAAASVSCSAWLIRSEATCHGSAVSSARTAISVGPGLRVDADPALEQPLRGGDPDVAGAGDQLGGTALFGAVGEHRDRLGTAGRVHLVDAEQGAGRQDRGVREPAVLLLRRRGDGQRPHAGLLRGHHVHHDGRRVDGLAAGHVQPDALHRHPPFGDGAARHHPHRGLGAALLAVDQAGPPERLLQRRTHGRVQFVQRAVQRRGRYPDTLQRAVVEPLGVLDQRSGPPTMHVLADRPHLLQGGLDVELGAGQQVAVDSVSDVGGAGTAQIDSGDHVLIVADGDHGPGVVSRGDTHGVTSAAAVRVQPVTERV